MDGFGDMEQEKKSLLKKYLVCFGVASLIALAIIWIKGFFTDSVAVNIQILSDAFFVSGILLTAFAGMMYISGEGALIGIGFILKNAALTFIPNGRKKHETYRDYRERKLGETKKSADHCILVAGLVFLAIGVIFTIIWHENFYQVSGGTK